MGLKAYILEEKEYLVEMRRYFHGHPEGSLKEFETCKKIEEELDTMGIPHRRIGETGVYGWIDGTGEGAKKIVALRADIDALAMEDLKTEAYRSQNQGFCHACGHDAHTATLLTAAKVLQKKKNTFAGQIRLFFQQAEEVGQGARLFVGEGLLESVDRVFGAHVASKLEAGKVALTKGPQCASCDYFKINIRGKGTHVSTPHLGIDAAYIAGQIVVNLQSIVARNTAPLETVVVGVGVIRAGTQYNIVAEHAEIEGTTRSFSAEVRKFTNERVRAIAKETGALYGAEVEITFLDYAAPLVNDPEVTAEVQALAKTLIGSDQIITDYEKALGADDFADFLAVVPGTYAFIGTGNNNQPNTLVAHHHGLFDLDEEALLLSCNLYVDYGLWVLNGGE